MTGMYVVSGIMLLGTKCGLCNREVVLRACIGLRGVYGVCTQVKIQENGVYHKFKSYIDLSF